MGAVNRAVRYSTDGGSTWAETLQDGQLLSAGYTKQFSDSDVKLTVTSCDYSRYAWASVKHIYNVFVTTSEYDGATGQCTQGKLRRRLESSDGVKFPSGNDVKVSKKMAEEACAGLGEQRDNCITDLRMVNEPDAVTKIKEDFDTVESTVTKLEATTTTTTTPSVTTPTESTTTTPPTETTTTTPPTETTTNVVVNSSTMTRLCVSTLALMTLLVV